MAAKIDGTLVEITGGIENNAVAIDASGRLKDAGVPPGGGGGGGVSDHGALSGLADDDHAQYHNDARGDARYYTQGAANAAFAPIAHASATNNPHSVTKAHVGLANVPDLKHNLAAAVDPAANDDSGAGYAVGSRWVNTVAGSEWVCVDASAGAAAWVKTTTSTSGAAGAAGNVQYNNGGALAAESPFTYDEANNMLLVDQELRDAIYPFASANIAGATTTLSFGFKQIARLTVTGNVTAPLALPTSLKQVTASSVGAATSYFALRQLIIRQNATGGWTFPTNFWSNYTLSGVPAPLPSAANAVQEYLLIGEWNGSAWVSWKVLGETNAFAGLVVTTTPVTLTKSTGDVLCKSGAATLNLPAAAGDGQVITIVNRSGGTITLAPNGSDTIAGAATTITNGDTIALIDTAVGTDEWIRI